MSATATVPRPPRGRTARRLLGSNLVDLMVGPHGIDRYLELIRPSLTIADARAEVVEVRNQTPRSVTLTLRPNAAFAGFTAGQFLKVGVEIDGVRRTRTYSPATSQHARDRRLELTVTLRDGGLVSDHLRTRTKPGTILHLSAAAGDFVLPTARPDRIALISGGSGITPILSMLRTLIDEGHGGEITFLHYARTEADHLYRRELEQLAAAQPNLSVEYVATREGGAHFSAETIPHLAGTDTAVCGPPELIEAVQRAAPTGRVIAETFTAPTLAVAGEQATGTLRFLTSDRIAEIQAGTLLEQAEAAGLTPEFGCRMGICHTCVAPLSAGTLRDLRDGTEHRVADTDQSTRTVQTCVTAAAGDCTVDL
jgi:ferredoxin-NADP reductase